MKKATDDFTRAWIANHYQDPKLDYCLFDTARFIRRLINALDAAGINDLNAHVFLGTALAIVEHLHSLAVPTVDEPPGRPPSTGAAEEGG